MPRICSVWKSLLFGGGEALQKLQVFAGSIESDNTLRRLLYWLLSWPKSICPAWNLWEFYGLKVWELKTIPTGIVFRAPAHWAALDAGFVVYIMKIDWGLIGEGQCCKLDAEGTPGLWDVQLLRLYWPQIIGR